MSPGVLASMWKDEEAKTKELEDQLKAKLKEKGVYIFHYFFNIVTIGNGKQQILFLS